MEFVKLRNGSKEAKCLVTATMLSFEGLLKERPIVAYELVMKCRNTNHQFFGESGDDLKALALLGKDGSVHESIRNIVLSAAKGDGLDMEFCSPIVA